MASAEVLKDLAPTGALRASINLGNIVLAQGTPGALTGVTVDLAHALGKRLGVPVELTAFDAAGKAFEALKAGAVDIVFLAIEPVRAAEIAFTAPYVIIEGCYAVRADSPLTSSAEVDAPGTTVAVDTASAYDLFLTRSLAHAALVRAPDGSALFLEGRADVLGGVKQSLDKFIAEHPERHFRVLEPRFMEIRQAMGTARGRTAGAAYLSSFIEEMKASGFVAAALERAGQGEATVAPAA